MKILFYSHTGQVSGAERMLLLALARLDRNRFSPVMVCPAPSPLMKMTEELGVRRETVDALEARFTWRVDRFLRYLGSFYRVIRQLRERVIKADPDLIHANSIRAGLVATAATVGLKVPVIWLLYDTLPRHPFSSAIRWFAAGSTRTHMVAASRSTRDRFRGPILNYVTGRAPVSVIYVGIELDRFDRDPEGVRAVRDELKLRGTEFVIGVVGQLTPRKGQLELLGAFSKVLSEVPQAILLVVGAPLFNRDHEYLAQLVRTADELGVAGSVRFLGARDDVAAVMQTLDLLVLNSRNDPFPGVLLEAMASGTPVLATAVDGVPELIRHGENGWLVPARDERALSTAITYLSRRPGLRKRIAERGRRHVYSHFSVDRYMRQLHNFYRKTCRPRLREDGREMMVEN